MEHFEIVLKLCRLALYGGMPDAPRQVGLLAHTLSRALRAEQLDLGMEADRRAYLERSRQINSLQQLLAKTHREVQPEQGELPTPETLRHLKTNTLGELLRQGSICREHYEAAEEIGDVFEAISAGQFPRALDPERVMSMDKNKRGPSTSALERLPAEMQRKYYRNYRPWVAEVETVSIAGSSLVVYSLLQLVIDVVIDGATLRDLETLFHRRHGALGEQFIQALHQYCQIAGTLPKAWSVQDALEKRT